MNKKILFTLTMLVINFHKNFNSNNLGQENKREWSVLIYIKGGYDQLDLIEEKLTQIKNGANKHCNISVFVDRELQPQNSNNLIINQENNQENNFYHKINIPRVIEKYAIDENLIKKEYEKNVRDLSRLDTILGSIEWIEKKSLVDKFFLVIIDLDKINERADINTPVIELFPQNEKDLRLDDKVIKEFIGKLSTKLNKPIDLIFLDSDLSCNIELAYSIANPFSKKKNAKLLISFQERFSPEIVDYSKILNLFKLHIKPLDFSKNIIELFDEKIPEQKRFSISLLNLEKLDLNLIDKFNTISASLSDFVGKNNCFLEAICQSRNNTTKFGDKRYLDINELYYNLSEKIKDLKCINQETIDTLIKYVSDGQEAIQNLVVKNKSNFFNGTISIYFPKAGKYSESYKKTLWARDTWWLHFLIKLKNSFNKNNLDIGKEFKQ